MKSALIVYSFNLSISFILSRIFFQPPFSLFFPPFFDELFHPIFSDLMSFFLFLCFVCGSLSLSRSFCLSVSLSLSLSLYLSIYFWNYLWNTHLYLYNLQRYMRELQVLQGIRHQGGESLQERMQQGKKDVK